MNKRVRLAALLCGALLPFSVAAEDTTYLFEIPASRDGMTAEPLGHYIQATIGVPNGDKARAVIEQTGAMDVISVDDAQVTIGVHHLATAHGAPDAKDLSDSFVIDYAEPAVQVAIDQLEETYGDNPSAAELEQFVFDYIDDKNYLRSFDFASKVADSRSGDCTEHAVLLAALARASGIPARVVLGVVLQAEVESMGAFGHAWTELHVGDRWRLADGTAPINGDQVGNTYYLPLLILENEGPGYGMDMARLFTVQPAKVTQIGPASPNSLSQKADRNE